MKSAPKSALLVLCFALPAFAQQVIALKAARLFDGTSDRVTANAVVVIDGTRIQSAGGSIPANATVVDLGDVTLLPGFIDAHTHVSFESGENYYRDHFEGLMRHPAEQALLATAYARRTIEAGVTTVRDVGSSDYVDIALRNAIANGTIVGPRMLVAVHAISGRHITALSGAIPITGSADRAAILATLQATDRWVRGQI